VPAHRTAPHHHGGTIFFLAALDMGPWGFFNFSISVVEQCGEIGGLDRAAFLVLFYIRLDSARLSAAGTHPVSAVESVVLLFYLIIVLMSGI
jgi:hypothetical protein